ncbi:MAG: A/G-specific adenine glycosylase [Chloroflexota bacterium]|nr:A/G-specific adenine glycosylase [Chloroflexota bacterium]
MITFWQQNGRHELPWRRATNAWSILLAEVLLRKTTSAQAAEVYKRLASYSPVEIAGMEQNALAIELQPLGIHQVRAKQLQQIAQAVIDTGGAVLESDEALRKLPGVGRYISNSVRCCAFGVAAPAMDTNLIRVMNRVFGWTSRRKRPREDRKLWERAKTLVPDDMPREFNWGMLDFAAAVCTQRRPKCKACPINTICNYYAVNGQAQALETKQ